VRRGGDTSDGGRFRNLHTTDPFGVGKGVPTLPTASGRSFERKKVPGIV